MAKMDKEKKTTLAIFLIVVFLFLIGMGLYTPSYSDVQEHSVMQDLDSIVFALEAFFRGDLDGFFSYALDAIVVLAIFMVVFALTHFLFTTIFKDTFKKHHSLLLSVLMAVYALVDHRIYNFFITLNVFAIAFLVFSMLILIIWGFSKKGVNDMNDSFKEARKSGKIAAMSKKELDALRREFDKKYNE